MKNSKYEYEPLEKINISSERQSELVSKLHEKLGGEDSIALFKVTSLAANEEECAFLLERLNSEDILIRGVNASLENEIENYERIMKVREPGDKGKGYKVPLMPKEERNALLAKLAELPKDSAEYSELVKKIAEGSLRIIDWTLHKFSNVRELKSSSFDEEDKRQWGAIALINAVKKFDISKGYQFSSYAVACIMKKITYEWERINEIPSNTYQRLQILENLRKKFSQDVGREPTNEEIKEILGFSDNMLNTVEKAKARMSIEFVGGENDVSKSAFEEGDEVVQVGDAEFLEGDYYEDAKIPDDDREEDIAVVEHGIFRDAVKKQLKTLTPREREIIEMRFGLYDGKNWTLEEVAEVYGLGRERVRQIEAKSLRKLRHPRRARHLKAFLDR